MSRPKRAPHLLQRVEFQNLEILFQVQVAPKHREEKGEKEGSIKQESKLSLEVQEGGPTHHVARPIWVHFYVQRFRFSLLKNKSQICGSM